MSSMRKKINSNKLWRGLNLVRKPISDVNYWEINSKYTMENIKSIVSSNIYDKRESIDSLNVDWNSRENLSSIIAEG